MNELQSLKMVLNFVWPYLKRVERELDVARVESGATLVLAHDGREVLERRLGDNLVRLLLQYLLNYLLFGLKSVLNQCNVRDRYHVGLVVRTYTRIYLLRKGLEWLNYSSYRLKFPHPLNREFGMPTHQFTTCLSIRIAGLARHANGDSNTFSLPWRC